MDIETSFLNEVEIRALMEELIRAVFKEAINVDLPNPFPIMLWTDAMNNYGSDKPDLRVKLKLTDLTDLMSNVDFKSSDPLPNSTTAASWLSAFLTALPCPAAKSTATPNSLRFTVPRGWPTSKLMTSRRKRRSPEPDR